MEYMELSALPREILLEILGYLNVLDLYHISILNKHFLLLSEENALWKPLYNLLRNDKARQNNRDENNLFFQFSKWKLNYKSLKLEETVGYAETFGNGSSHSKNFLLGFRVSLPKPAILRYIGIIGKSQKQAPEFLMGLYSDKKQKPRTLVAATKRRLLENGRMEMCPYTPAQLRGEEPPHKSIQLKATYYWLMAAYSGDASVGEKTLSPQENIIRYKPFVFPVNEDKDPVMLPETFDEVHSKYKGNLHNYYLVVTYLK